MKKFHIRCPDCGGIMAESNNSRELLGKEYTCDGPHDEVVTFTGQLIHIGHGKKKPKKGWVMYNKLVRDKIPDIIMADGGECKFHVAKKDEFARVLGAKLHEEVNELSRNPCAEEIADVLEVIEALARIHHIHLDEIKAAKKMKREDRGGFNLMFVLDEATEFKLRKGEEVIKPGYINGEENS